jgi:hypothetical protein
MPITNILLMEALIVGLAAALGVALALLSSREPLEPQLARVAEPEVPAIWRR